VSRTNRQTHDTDLTKVMDKLCLVPIDPFDPPVRGLREPPGSTASYFLRNRFQRFHGEPTPSAATTSVCICTACSVFDIDIRESAAGCVYHISSAQTTAVKNVAAHRQHRTHSSDYGADRAALGIQRLRG
jgi:hypothetical protein